MAKRLYLMRHGQTLYNVQKLVQGRCDSPLTSTGIEQAREASEWLARQGVSFDRICSSPLGRAYNTACIAREALQKAERASGAARPVPKIEVVDGLIERSYGPYEEGPQDAVPAGVWDPGEALVPCGGEGSEAVRARMVATLRGIMEREDARNVLAVSHGSATLQFKRAWEHAARCDQGRPLGNCCILVFDYDEDAGSFSNTEIVNLPA